MIRKALDPLALALLILLGATTGLYHSEAQAATLSAEVDRHELAMGEYVTFKLSLHNSDTRLRVAGVSPNVDLTLLSDDFELGVPRAENRFNMQRSRGRSTSSITVELFPRRPGTLAIPPFQIDGLSSAAIAITAHPAASQAAPTVFIRSGLSNTHPWHGEQVTAYLDIYSRVAIGSARLGADPEFESAAGLEKLAPKKLPSAERHEQQQGFDYTVMRVTWAFHVTTLQPLTLYLPDLWITTASGQRLRFPAAVHRINAKPLPDYLPAGLPVGTLTLEQSAITTPLNVGEAALWHIRINTTAQERTLPQRLAALKSDGRYQLYHDRPLITSNASADGLSHRATYNVSLLPHQAGPLTTPGIEIDYFDSRLGVLSSARLPGQQVTVAAAPINIATAPHQPAPNVSAATTSVDPASLWRALAMALGGAWLLSLVAFAAYAKRQQPREIAATPPPMAIAQNQGQRPPQQQLLLDAFASPTLQQGLQHWQQQHGDDAEISNCVKAVQKQCYGNGPAADMPSVLTIAEKIRNTPPRSESENVRNPWHSESFSRAIEQPGTQR